MKSTMLSCRREEGEGEGGRREGGREGEREKRGEGRREGGKERGRERATSKKMYYLSYNSRISTIILTSGA